MKRLIGTIVIFLIIAGIAATGFFINTRTADMVMEKVQKSQQYAIDGNIENAKKELAEAIDEWEKKIEIMLLFVSHGKLDEIEEAINIANSYIQYDEVPLFYAECQRASTLLDHFKSVEYPSINNIF
ncbi:MAG: DUF4363 family protein [Clostridia bacterium]|nr:DUF4363 family protein [Clostridia bacterium]